MAEDLGRLSVIAAATVMAVLGPALAYSVYPGEPPVHPIDEPAPPFVEALGHCSAYRGVVTVTGVVVDASSHTMLIRVDDEYLTVMLHGCWLGQGIELTPRGLAEQLLGREVTITGHLYLTGHGPAVRPTSIKVGHITYVPTPCKPWTGEGRHHQCPMCPS